MKDLQRELILKKQKNEVFSELQERITFLSLESGILSDFTAFIGVAKVQIHNFRQECQQFPQNPRSRYLIYSNISEAQSIMSANLSEALRRGDQLSITENPEDIRSSAQVFHREARTVRKSARFTS